MPSSAAVRATGPWPLHPLAFGERAQTWVIESPLLAGNPAGESARRELLVYEPAAARGRELPLVLVLCAFGARPLRAFEPHPWQLGFVHGYQRLLEQGLCAPAVLAFPDPFTRLGGSQFVDSSWNGPFARHVAFELVEFLEQRYRLLPARRGLIGKSSGGFGALHLALQFPGRFAALAALSPDLCFELSLQPQLTACLRGLVAHDFDPARFLAAFERAPALEGDAHAVLNTLAMASCYSPAPELALGFELPMSLRTGELVPRVWQRWLAYDPLPRIERDAAGLAQLEFLHLECGLRDEFDLQWGLRRFAAKLAELGIRARHVEHPGSHRGLDARYVEALPPLVSALAGDARA
jgi:pimeloyl-ACP methyl ester carboxylesterase